MHSNVYRVVSRCLHSLTPSIAAERNNSTFEASTGAKPSFSRGVSFESRREWRAALDAYLKTVDIQPTFAPAWLRLGNCYFELHDYNHAEQCYRHASEKLMLHGEELKSCLLQLIRCEDKDGELEGVFNVLAMTISATSRMHLMRRSFRIKSTTIAEILQ